MKNTKLHCDILNQELNPEQIIPALTELQAAHHLRGVFIPGSHPVLLVRALSSKAKLKRWGCDYIYGCFGASANLVARFADGSVTIVCVPVGTKGFDTLGSERIRIAVVFGKQIIETFEIGEAPFAQLCRDANDYQPIASDNMAHYWEVLSTLYADNIVKLSSRDRLSVGWIRQYQTIIRGLSENLSDFQRLHSHDPPTEIDSLETVLLRENYDVTRLMQCVEDKLARGGRNIQNNFSWLDIPDAGDLSIEVWVSYLYSPKITDCGRRVPWLCSRNGQLEFTQVEVDEFPPDFKPESYWKLVDLGNSDWGTIVTGHDIPVCLKSVQDEWENLGGVDADEVKSCVENLYAEAVANKRGTIPERANIEPCLGPFTSVELTEIEPRVVAILRTSTGEFHEVVIIPKRGFSTFCLPKTMPSPKREAIMAEVNLWLAAVIRDFWVVEEREAIFAHRKKVLPKKLQSPTSNKSRVVYIPKIRYSEPPNVPRCANVLGHAKRRLHNVAPHLRRLVNGRQASEHQQSLAEVYGFHCKEGYTFVASYNRGSEKGAIIYRSRSALNSLYSMTSQSTNKGEPDRWFQFERDIHIFMEALHLLVERYTTSRYSSNSIVIYATKGSEPNQKKWIVLCKCLHPKRKISANVIREFVDVLSGYPKTVRGMVVTTSSFSPEAAKVAESNSIRLINGEEFMAMVKFATEYTPPPDRLAG